jgi:hypothetical protein
LRRETLTAKPPKVIVRLTRAGCGTLGVCRLYHGARSGSELAAVVVSLLGYLFSVITVFTAAAVVMIGLFSVSTSEKVRHYPHPRPEIEQTVTATNMEPRLFMVVPETKDGLPAKAIEDARAVPIEKADAEKRKRERYLQKRTRHRENYEGHGYATTLDFAERSGYRPGLDNQR